MTEFDSAADQAPAHDQAIAGLIQWLWSFITEVVGRGLEPPLRTRRGSASSLESAKAAVELVLGED